MKKTYSSTGDGLDEMSFVINRKEIKIRKKWNINPVTKVLPKKKSKREKDNVRKRIVEELDDFESNQ